MTKKDLARILSEKEVFASKAEAERKIDQIFEQIEGILLAGEDLNILGFGKFEIVERAARLGRNPKTNETIAIEAKKSVKFKPGKKLVESMN